MDSFKNISTLKAEARENLIGFYILSACCIMLYYIIYSAFLTLPWSFFPGEGSRFSNAVRFILLFLCFLLTYKAKIGVYSIFLHIASKKKVSLRDIITRCIPTRISRNEFMLSAFRTTIDMFFLLTVEFTATAAYGEFSKTHIIFYGIWALLLVFYIYLDIQLTPLYFLVEDITDQSFFSLLLLNGWLIKGQKFRLLKLNISFIPLIILGAFSMGLGLLYVYPYMFVSIASFYLNLTSVKAKEKTNN